MGASDTNGESRAAAPKPRTDIDVTTLALNAKEGFVLSRVDGQTPTELLCELLGMSDSELIPILRRLAEVGAVEWEGASASADSGTAMPLGLGSGVRTQPKVAREDPELQAALAEECDLTRAERVRIIVAHRDQRHSDYWEIFGLTGDPSAADIKKAYFDLSKQFHPDRFFGRRLGSFGKRIDDIFRGLKDAYDILGDAKKRALYRADHPPPAPAKKKSLPLVDTRYGKGKQKAAGETQGEAEPVVRQRKDPAKAERIAQRRAEIIAERRQARIRPLEDKAKKARELYDLGLKQLADKDVVAAARSLKIAAAYAPQNAEYQTRLDEVQQIATQLRTRELVEQADLEAATGQLISAARSYGEASDLVPTMAKHAMRAAECYEAAGERGRAVEYAERAVKASPRRLEARLLVASILAAKGDKVSALAHLEVALSLDKGNPEVKGAIKRLSKSTK